MSQGKKKEWPLCVARSGKPDQKPEAGPEAGSWKLEAGLEAAGSQEPEARSQKPEDGGQKPKAGIQKPEAGKNSLEYISMWIIFLSRNRMSIELRIH